MMAAQPAIGHNNPPPIIELWLPFPPTANHIWRTSGKRVYRSAKYMKWREEAAVESLASFKQKQKITGPYKLNLTAKRPDKRRRDLDNLIKPVSDLLTFIGAIEDDSLCEAIHMRWATQGDGVYVRIEKAGME